MRSFGSLWLPPTDRDWLASRVNTLTMPANCHPSVNPSGEFLPQDEIGTSGLSYHDVARLAEEHACRLLVVLKMEYEGPDGYHQGPHVEDVDRIVGYARDLVRWLTNQGAPDLYGLPIVKIGHEISYRGGPWEWDVYYRKYAEEIVPGVLEVLPSNWPALTAGNKPGQFAFPHQPSLNWWLRKHYPDLVEGSAQLGYGWQGNWVADDATFGTALAEWGGAVTEDTPVGDTARRRAEMLVRSYPDDCLYMPVMSLEERYYPRPGQVPPWLLCAYDGYWSDAQATALTVASRAMGVYREPVEPDPEPWDPGDANVAYSKLWKRTRHLVHRDASEDEIREDRTLSRQMRKFREALAPPPAPEE